MAILFNGMVFGHAGIVLADWRLPRYVTDFPSLIENITSRLEFFATHVVTIFRTPVTRLFILLTIVFLAGWRYRERQFRVLYPFIVCAMVGFIPYLMTILVGVYINYRVVLSLFAGVIFLLVMLSAGHPRQLLYISLTACCIGIPSWWDSRQSLQWYRDTTHTVSREIRQALPEEPLTRYASAVVDMREYHAYLKQLAAEVSIKRPPFLQSFHPSIQWGRALEALGLKDITVCDDLESKKACRIFTEDRYQGCKYRSHHLCMVGAHQDTLLLRLLPEPEGTAEQAVSPGGIPGGERRK